MNWTLIKVASSKAWISSKHHTLATTSKLWISFKRHALTTSSKAWVSFKRHALTASQYLKEMLIAFAVLAAIVVILKFTKTIK